MANLYTDITAELLFDRMLARYSDEFDKREGSITWDEFANVALELRHLYIQLDWQWAQMFGDTAGREALIRLAKDRGIEPIPARASVVQGVFNVEMQVGERFSVRNSDVNFIITEPVVDTESPDTYYRYEMRCEELGSVGNIVEWPLVPIRTINGLTYAKIEKILIPGEDEEATEEFRQRYYETLKHNKYGFNVAEYQYQVNMLQGVGAVRTYPADPEPGQVRLVILNNDLMPASEELIAEVQEVIDPVPFAQKGIGRAPIGHLVTVYTAETDPIDFEVRLSMAPGLTTNDVALKVEEAIGGYLKELRDVWEKAYDPADRTQIGMTVRQAHIDTRLLAIDGVEDVYDTLINGIDGNYEPEMDALPIMGEVTYGTV